MDLDGISNTIYRALGAAGLDPQRGAWPSVTQTIRQALAHTGLTPTGTPPPTRRFTVGNATGTAEAFVHEVPAYDDQAPGPETKTKPAPGQFLSRRFVGSSGSRAYKLYVPASVDRREAMPLIVMLHGCKQNPDDFAAGTGMNALAERHGFLVAYPEQTARENGANCWNWFSVAEQSRSGTEPSIIAGIVHEIAACEAVNMQRVFIAGLSAGAAMAVILGVTHADVFAAVGAHSGLPHGAACDVPSAFAAMHGGTQNTDSRLAVPTIVFHGDQDRTVVAANGNAIVAQALAGHAEPLQKKTMPGRAAGGSRQHVRSVWLDEGGTPRVEQWALHGGAHAWSGGSPAGSYTDTQGPDASAEMVRFFLAQ